MKLLCYFFLFLIHVIWKRWRSLVSSFSLCTWLFPLFLDLWWHFSDLYTFLTFAFQRLFCLLLFWYVTSGNWDVWLLELREEDSGFGSLAEDYEWPLVPSKFPHLSPKELANFLCSIPNVDFTVKCIYSHGYYDYEFMMQATIPLDGKTWASRCRLPTFVKRGASMGNYPLFLKNF